MLLNSPAIMFLEKTLSVIRYELGMRRKVLESMMAAESQSTGKNQKNL